MSTLDELQHRRRQIAGNPDFPDDALALACCDLALNALEKNNYGVGALVTDATGEIVARAANAVFGPPFDSAGHAEMRVLSQFEQHTPCPAPDAELFVLLEPCPMCCSRMLYAGLRAVRWVIPDPDGGMMHQTRKLPAAWRNLAQRQHHSRARVSPEVFALCEAITHSNAQQLREQWREHMDRP